MCLRVPVVSELISASWFPRQSGCNADDVMAWITNSDTCSGIITSPTPTSPTHTHTDTYYLQPEPDAGHIYTARRIINWIRNVNPVSTPSCLYYYLQPFCSPIVKTHSTWSHYSWVVTKMMKLDASWFCVPLTCICFRLLHPLHSDVQNSFSIIGDKWMKQNFSRGLISWWFDSFSYSVVISSIKWKKQ